ncbi:MAG: hypothetical protein WCK34_06835 [Bacteroidota bacterium]
MRHIPVSCLIFLLIASTFMVGCKKDNSKKDFYSGTYSFTTITTSYPDSVIHYNGSVSYDKASKALTINYMEEIYSYSFPCTIYPVADDKGVLSYPGWTALQSAYFFNGNIDYSGNLNFKIGLIIIHQGQNIESSRTVTGKKKQESEIKNDIP